MAGHLQQLPVPYPDEMLESWLARYQLRRGLRRNEDVSYTLLGLKAGGSSRSLPVNHLPLLAAKLDPRMNLAWEDLFNLHTLGPYYLAFAPQARRAEAMRSIAALEYRAVLKLGFHRAAPKPPRGFRYCPVCATEDREGYGEAYWHRIHHLPGTMVCPTHGVQLNATSVPIYGSEAYSRPAELIIPKQMEPASMSLDPFMVSLAFQSEWVLRNHHLIDRDKALRNIRWALWDSGIVRYGRRVLQADIDAALRDRFSSQFLEHLGLLQPGTTIKWGAALVNGSRAQWHMQPTRYILIAMLARDNIADVVLDDPRPFGEGPWPCLNPAAQHKGDLRIHDYELQFFNSYDKGYAPKAVFRCSCGFEYWRRGPDSTGRDRLRMDGVVQYGELFHRTVRARHSNGDPISHIAQDYGIAWVTAKAIILGGEHEPKSATRARIEDRLDQAKATITAALKAKPQASRTELYWKHTGLYRCIKRHDPDWIEATIPSRVGGRAPLGLALRFRPDYVDRELAAHIRDQAKSFRSQGHPHRISTSKLLRSASHVAAPATVQRHLQELPRTRRAIEECNETWDQFYRRLRGQ